MTVGDEAVCDVSVIFDMLEMLFGDAMKLMNCD